MNLEDYLNSNQNPNIFPSEIEGCIAKIKSGNSEYYLSKHAFERFLERIEL